MSDAIYGWLEAWQRFWDSWTVASWPWLVVFWVLFPPLTVLCHEVGHALIARCLGLRVRELVSGTRGPAARFRIGATSVRIGLGLGRSRSPNGFAGWVTLDQSRAVEVWKLIVFLVAGSAAQALLGGTLALAAFLAPFSGYRHSLLVLGAIYCMIAATCNLLPSKDRRNDGAQIADLLAQAKDGSPEPPRQVDPNAATSVPPPGLER